MAKDTTRDGYFGLIPETRHEGSRFNAAGGRATSSRKVTRNANQAVTPFSEHKSPLFKHTAKYPAATGGK